MAEAKKLPYKGMEVAVYAHGGTVFIEVSRSRWSQDSETSFVKTEARKWIPDLKDLRQSTQMDPVIHGHACKWTRDFNFCKAME